MTHDQQNAIPARQWMTVDDYGWEGEATEVFDSLDEATAYYDKLVADAKAHGATETIYLCEVIKSEAVNPGN